MIKRKNGNSESELLTIEQTAQKSNLGICTVRKLATESGSAVKIGKSVRVNWKKFFDYLTTEYAE